MSYEIEIVRKTDCITTTWSGGTTTQLGIYPKGAKYSDRNFIWRLSSAKVEIEESTFTNLTGIKRIILILEGVVKLEHVGHYEVILTRFEQDSFLGDWLTKSYGKVIDFNLMMNEKCEGRIEVMNLTEKPVNIFNNVEPYNTYAIYCVNGNVSLFINNKEYHLSSQDTIIVSNLEKDQQIRVTSQNNADIIRVCIINNDLSA